MIAGDADLSVVGALLAEPARARVLMALGDGRALPASMLAAEAGVSASTASEHLRKLLGGGLVIVKKRGRYRYYQLAGPQVSELLEVMSRVAPPQPVTSLREGTRANALRRARSCYDHLGGRLAVALASAFLERGFLERGFLERGFLERGFLDGHAEPDGHDGSVDQDRMTAGRPAGGIADPVAYTLTDAGASALADLGAEPPRNRSVRCCVDWTEQRHHMSGAVGGILLQRFRELDWIRPGRYNRAILVTPAGREELASRFGVRAELDRCPRWDNAVMTFELTDQIERHLIGDQIVWLTTVTPTGWPAPKPVWFVWDGSVITVYSLNAGAKLRHIEASDKVSLHFDSGPGGGDIVVISGRARLDPDAPPPSRFPGILDKYQPAMEAMNQTAQWYDDNYAAAIRITPERAWTIP